MNGMVRQQRHSAEAPAIATTTQGDTWVYHGPHPFSRVLSLGISRRTSQMCIIGCCALAVSEQRLVQRSPISLFIQEHNWKSLLL